jgi:hypothetical protein
MPDLGLASRVKQPLASMESSNWGKLHCMICALLTKLSNKMANMKAVRGKEFIICWNLVVGWAKLRLNKQYVA